jgi:phage gpG-like protein
MTIKMEWKGDTELVAHLGSFAPRLLQRLIPVMNRLGLELRGVVEANLSGRVLKQRSGRLARAQQLNVTSDASGVSAAVGFDPHDVPYGAINEFGGTTRAHLIEAKNAMALRFSLGGKVVFAKSVHHPGSVIPERSFLRSALAQVAPHVPDEISEAISAEATA